MLIAALFRPRSSRYKVCENIPVSETGARAYVASKLLDAAAHGQLSTDALKAAGRKALNPPTMWR
ncbi:hypothetical protein LPJ38_07485 [Bradyrhizobium daqingense]|nr:hypothetical protein [Bradyrhizobium daqingense]UFS93024.1 hypothetical protein LPJ38_07485 [Bradyrhizobium daqingense]